MVAMGHEVRILQEWVNIAAPVRQPALLPAGAVSLGVPVQPRILVGVVPTQHARSTLIAIRAAMETAPPGRKGRSERGYSQPAWDWWLLSAMAPGLRDIGL
jgi:hypothetical protein